MRIRVWMSRALNGSSINRMSGSTIQHWAMATRFAHSSAQLRREFIGECGQADAVDPLLGFGF